MAAYTRVLPLSLPDLITCRSGLLESLVSASVHERIVFLTMHNTVTDTMIMHNIIIAKSKTINLLYYTYTFKTAI